MAETLEEHMQLQRVFRILAVDIPDKRLSERLEARSSLDTKLTELYQTLLRDGVDAHNHQEAKRLEGLKATYVSERAKLHDQVASGRRVAKEALVQVFEKLGQPRSMGDVEDLIWEVNDSLDGGISWDEFKRAFVRCKYDKTCLEPSDLFHLTCFLMYDRECTGKVSMDDAMRILFLKHGNHMEDEMESLFGKRLKDGELILTLTFPQYFEAVERRRIDTVDSLTAAAKGRKRGSSKASIRTTVQPESQQQAA
ncbi:hypothetical protein LEN26_000895 [Aphanomyces euteiches]|nr:hypothetical protein AeMF1_010797 [Aphanomyces euteiches]KAH9153674.1 hypothetical protein AeRB84_004110 [Aphanomyces euteiches]KAH9162567.1 hypothetical protein LEN26_000895 [Aphanomyces euteiches]KAH9192437.1 hypothetical protein AeNC1_005591 [Aphanomyces euteiches]